MPLSFVASIFGMNVAEFNDGNLNLRTEFIYMCKFSALALDRHE
jgi:Mg2+ and Co2+ transporter CorA